MPFFIALGDEIRLTIVEVLTEAASKNCSGDFSRENMSRHGLNVKEITEYTSLSRPAVSHHLKIFKRGWTYRYQALGDLQLLLSHNLRGHS